MTAPDYIRKFNQVIESNPAYLKRIVENRWGYFGKQPEEWLKEQIKKARGWLLANEKKGKRYKDHKKFMGNWLNRSYDFERPQDLKTYIDNKQEQSHYNKKRSN